MWMGTPEEAEAWERQRRIAERVASRPPQAPLSERYDWERTDRTPEHPGGTGMKRVRPRSVLSRIPRSMRLAEVVCAAAGGRPRVVAVVYPRGVPVERCEVETEHGNPCPVGTNTVLFCACGVRHNIDGGRLRSALLALPPTARKTPTLDVGGLS